MFEITSHYSCTVIFMNVSVITSIILHAYDENVSEIGFDISSKTRCINHHHHSAYVRATTEHKSLKCFADFIVMFSFTEEVIVNFKPISHINSETQEVRARFEFMSTCMAVVR